MSILIKGMEMPTSCGDCKAFVCYRQWAGDIGDCFCGITKNDAKAKEKNADCPLVPVPEHGRLGDLDKLADNMRSATAGMEHRAIIMHEIRRAPTIIPAEEGE